MFVLVDPTTYSKLVSSPNTTRFSSGSFPLEDAAAKVSSNARLLDALLVLVGDALFSSFAIQTTGLGVEEIALHCKIEFF